MRRLAILAAAARSSRRRRPSPAPSSACTKPACSASATGPTPSPIPTRTRAAARPAMSSTCAARSPPRSAPACAPNTCWCTPASASSRCMTARSISCATPARSPSRAARSWISRFPTYLDGAGVLSRKSAPVQRFEDLAGKRVGVLIGTTTERLLRDSLRALGITATIDAVRDHRNGMELVQDAKLDAYIADRGILAAMLRQRRPARLRIEQALFQLRDLRAGAAARRQRLPPAGGQDAGRALSNGQDRSHPGQDLRPRAARPHAQGHVRDQCAAGKVNVKSAKKKSSRRKAADSTMTTAEATVASLIAHGYDTVYALPGVHNDHLFDAFQRAGEALRVVHTRHEQGAAYMALGAALATGKPQAYAVVPGPGLLNSGAALLTAYGMNAPVLALIGQIPAGDYRPRARPSARNPRPGRHHFAAGRPFAPASTSPAEAPAKVAKAIRVDAPGPARPGRARMRHRHVGQARRACRRSRRPPPARPPQDRRGRRARGRQAAGQGQARADRRRRRRAGCLARKSRCSPTCCRRR